MKRFIVLAFLLATLANFSVSHAQVCFRYDQKDSCSSYPITDFKFGSYAGLGLTGLGAIAGGIGYVLRQID
jgi:hypothetical protein